MIKVNDAQFNDEVLKADVLAIVDFGAEWCGPCKKLHPIMEEIGTELDGKVKIIEMDVAESPQTALKFGVTSVPQLLFFQNGEIKETVIGLLPKTKIMAKIEDYL
jgi:thioredoxin 1